MKLGRIFSLATLAISIPTFYLMLKRPAAVAGAAASPAAVAANAQSFQEKLSQVEQPRSSAEPSSEVRINSAELSAALAQASGMMAASATSPANGNGSSSAASQGASGEFAGAVPQVKDCQVAMDGDIVRGQFLTQIAGKDVYITLGGHLGAKDGYATFDATEAKVGDLTVPVVLVNETLQRRLAEQRDQLKLPDNIKNIKIENGELVLVPK